MVSFGAHYINADIGASKILGTLKMVILDENNKEIAKGSETVFADRETRNEAGFEDNVAQKIADFKKKHQDEILKADPKDETYLAVCYPGPVVKDGISLTNFYYGNDRKQPFKIPINTDNIDKFIAERGINLIKPTRHVNDMVACGAAVLSALEKDYRHSLLVPGREILYLYPGGGLGSGVIMVDDDRTVIKPTEKQQTLGPRRQILEADGSSNGLIKHFTKALGVPKGLLDEDTVAVGDFEKAKKYLGNLEEKDFNLASKAAIDKFMDSIAIICARQICEGSTNAVVITGPIANGLKDAVNKNPEFKASSISACDDKFCAILKEKTRGNLKAVGRRLMGKDEDFCVLVLELLPNTHSMHKLQKSKGIGSPPTRYSIMK